MKSRTLRARPGAWARSVALLGVGMAVSALPATGQTFLPDPVEQPVVELQWEKPFLPGADGLKAYSSNLEVDAVFPWKPGMSLQVGLPLAFAGADFIDGTSVYLGNLRASLLFGEPGTLRSFVGVTLPTASNVIGQDLAVLVGVLPWTAELEKWAEDALSVRGAVLPSRTLENGGRIGLRLGGSAVLPTDWENLFLFARAAGWARLPLESTELRADLQMSYDVTGDDGFGQQFSSYLDLGAELTDVSARPGFFLRIPLDEDARNFLDLSIGLRAQL